MRELTATELKQVAGGLLVSNEGGDGDHCGGGAPRRKGNNGWGNGAEGTNAGSLSGGTAGSKSDETWSTGDGPRPRKFINR